VLSAPGDRRDQDMLEIAAAAAGAFDRFILRRDDDPRGRAEGEITGILRRGLEAAGVAHERIDVIEHEVQALAAGLEIAQAGDLLVVFGDQITRCWKQIIAFGGDAGESRRGRLRELEGLGGIGALAPVEREAPRAPVSIREVSRPRPLARPPVIHEVAPPDEAAVSGGMISDARGVRLAREREETGD
jgi:cyanophycin synthetase